MNRESVEVLLEIAEARTAYMPAPEVLAELASAWLALDAAPVAEVGYDGSAGAFLYFDGAPKGLEGCQWNAIMAEKLDGKRVRLVPTPAAGGQES